MDVYLDFSDKLNEYRKIWKHLFNKLDHDGIIEHDYILYTFDSFIDTLNIPENFTGVAYFGRSWINFENGLYRNSRTPIVALLARSNYFSVLEMIGNEIYRLTDGETYSIFFKNKKLNSVQVTADYYLPAVQGKNIPKRYFIDGVEYAYDDLKYAKNYKAFKETKGKPGSKYNNVINIMSYKYNFKETDNEKSRKTAHRFGIPVETVNKIINNHNDFDVVQQEYYDILDYYNKLE